MLFNLIGCCVKLLNDKGKSKHNMKITLFKGLITIVPHLSSCGAKIHMFELSLKVLNTHG